MNHFSKNKLSLLINWNVQSTVNDETMSGIERHILYYIL